MSDVSPEIAPKALGNASAKGGGGETLPQLPDASIFRFGPVVAKPPAFEPRPEREEKKPSPRPAGSAVFEALVTGESDLVGFVAYGIYKQNKRDFLTVFETTHGRPPDATEIGAYMTGEATSRRLATYRQLAENFLAAYGDGRTADDTRSAADPGAASDRASPPPPRTLAQLLSRPMAARHRRRPGWLPAAYVAFLILLLAGMIVLIRGGFSPLGGFGR